MCSVDQGAQREDPGTADRPVTVPLCRRSHCCRPHTSSSCPSTLTLDTDWPVNGFFPTASRAGADAGARAAILVCPKESNRLPCSNAALIDVQRRPACGEIAALLRPAVPVRHESWDWLCGHSWARLSYPTPAGQRALPSSRPAGRGARFVRSERRCHGERRLNARDSGQAPSRGTARVRLRPQGEFRWVPPLVVGPVLCWPITD